MKSRKSKKTNKSKKNRRTLRKKVKGGFLPALIPLLAPILSSLGAVAAGSAGIASAVNKAKQNAKVLEEMKRHDRAMEGKGLRFKKSKRRPATKKKIERELERDFI
jgi:hypothetical protein